MSTPRTLALNPSDALFFAVHEHMRSRGEGGYVAAMELEADGPVPEEDMRDVVGHLVAAHPVLGARVVRSPLLRRVRLRLPGSTAAPPPYEYVDLRSVADPDDALDARTRRAMPSTVVDQVFALAVLDDRFAPVPRTEALVSVPAAGAFGDCRLGVGSTVICNGGRVLRLSREAKAAAPRSLVK